MTPDSISFRELCLEIFKENGGDKSGQSFQNFYSEQRDRFVELFKALGVDPEVLKEGTEYKIPTETKKHVKDMLHSYTSPNTKKLRKRKYESMSVEDIGTPVKQLEEVLKARFGETEDFEQLRSILHITTRLSVKIQAEAILKLIEERIVSKVKAIEPFFTDDTLNDNDKAQLLVYYSLLLEEATLKWCDVTSIVSDLRDAEISDISEAEFAGGAMSDLDFAPSEKVIAKAIQEYRGDMKREAKNSKKPPNKENWEAVRKLIEEHKHAKGNR